MLLVVVGGAFDLSVVGVDEWACTGSPVRTLVHVDVNGQHAIVGTTRGERSNSARVDRVVVQVV